MGIILDVHYFHIIIYIWETENPNCEINVVL